MTRRWLLPIAFSLAGFASGACAAIPPPSVLAEIDRVRESPSAKIAKRDAPAAFAVAEKLRDDAHAAFDAEDSAAAQILAERALAAYEEAVALARVVRADKERELSTAELKKQQTQMATLDDEHQKVAADIEALERRLKVLRNLEGVSPSGPAGPAREKARWQAVSSLHLGARLLCSAAKLLVAARRAEGKYEPPAAVAKGDEALAELDATVAKKPASAPIDAAMRARAACLEGLTRVRRSAEDPKKATGAGDALLEDLSKLGHGSPSRDDHGVVVTLRGVVEAGAITSQHRSALEAIAKVAKSHARFPVMVVVHDAAALDDASRKASADRGAKVVVVLRDVLGKGRVADAQLAGNAKPLVDPKGPSASRNARIEIVFVSPENL